MSAFLCDPKQVAVVAKALVTFEGGRGDPVEIAKQLGLLNVQSVAYRYKRTDEETTQDFASLALDVYLKECGDEVANVPQYTPERLLGLIGSFLYQSCEKDELYHGDLYQRVNALESHIEAAGIKREGWAL